MSLQNEMLQNKLLTEQNDSLKLNLKQANQDLLHLRKTHQETCAKLQKIYYYLQYYRNIYSKYLNLLSLLPSKSAKMQQTAELKEISLNKLPSKTSTRRNFSFNEDNFCDVEGLDKKIKGLIKRDKDKGRNLSKSPQEIEDLLSQDINADPLNTNKKQRYLTYLKKMATEFVAFLEKNNNPLEKSNNLQRKITFFDLKAFQSVQCKNALFLNNSDFLDYEPSEVKENRDLLDIMEMHHELQKKLKNTEKKPDFNNLSNISKDSDIFNMNMSFLNENLNDVSQTGEIFVMNKFQNPFSMNFKSKKEGQGQYLNTHPKVLSKLYSPLSKINPDMKEISFENVEGRKNNNMSFISNNDELFF